MHYIFQGIACICDIELNEQALKHNQKFTYFRMNYFIIQINYEELFGWLEMEFYFIDHFTSLHLVLFIMDM